MNMTLNLLRNPVKLTHVSYLASSSMKYDINNEHDLTNPLWNHVRLAQVSYLACINIKKYDKMNG